MRSIRYAQQAQALAKRLAPGKERKLDNRELREIFGGIRITAGRREEIVQAFKQAGLEVVSGATTQPLIVRKPATQGTPAAVSTVRPWFKRKRIWALAGVLFFLLAGAIGSAFDPSDNIDPLDAAITTTQTVPPDAAGAATTTDTTTTPVGSTRADAEDMVDDNLYAEALAAAALLGNDDENYIARRIANRLARRTMFALDSGDRSRARFLVLKARDYPSTSISRRASAAYDEAQARAKARAAARRAEARARAARESAERAAREAQERAAEAVPDVPDTSAPDTSGPSTTNWCGKRDGDGDGIYCE